MKEHFKLEAIKRILVEMTADDKLPTDMTTLDIHSIGEQAEKRLKTDKHYQRACKLEKLVEFVSPESDNHLNEMLNILEGYEDPNKITGWIDGITMAQRYETSFTVKELIQEIS